MAPDGFPGATRGCLRPFTAKNTASTGGNISLHGRLWFLAEILWEQAPLQCLHFLLFKSPWARYNSCHLPPTSTWSSHLSDVLENVWNNWLGKKSKIYLASICIGSKRRAIYLRCHRWSACFWQFIFSAGLAGAHPTTTTLDDGPSLNAASRHALLKSIA